MGWSDPVDTIRLQGGTGLSVIDTEVMAAVCRWLAQMADALQLAAWQLRGSHGLLENAAHALAGAALSITVSPWATPATSSGMALAKGTKQYQNGTLLSQGTNEPSADWLAAKAAAERQRAELQDRAARARMVADQASQAAQAAQTLAAEVTEAQRSLAKAMGVYDDAESRNIRAMRVLSQTDSLGHLLFRGGIFSEWLIPTIAPYSDEVIAGLSWGLAGAAVSQRLFAPRGLTGIWQNGLVAWVLNRRRQQATVTAAAGVLSRGAHGLLPVTALGVAEIVPGHGGLLNCPNPMPQWQGTPSGSIKQLLSRVGDLHPFDAAASAAQPSSGTYPECSRTGLPKGTIAVEKITRYPSVEEPPVSGVSKPRELTSVDAEQAATTWVVMIPGTQNFAPGNHAFDGVTDLDLMAGAPSQVGEQVMKALELAGVPGGEPVVLIGHSLGGIAAVSIAASREFNAKYQLGGVITAGSPTATFRAQPGVPYLHIENDEEIVSNLDGKSGDNGPATKDRVIVTRQLAASNNEIDQNASKSLTGAHPIETHQRTLDLALASGNPNVHNIVAQLEELLKGDESETRFFTGRRVVE